MARNGPRLITLFGGCVLAALVACQFVTLDPDVAYRCADGGACELGRVCIEGFCRLPPDAGGGGEDGGPDATVPWTFENPLSGGRDLYAVHGRGSNDVLAVGERGVALRWNGSRWAVVDTGIETGLEGVWMAIDSKAYAVGDGGMVLHWNGVDWRAVPVPTSKPYDLHAVSGNPTIGPVVAAGDRQTIDTVDSLGRHNTFGARDWVLSDGGLASVRGISVSSALSGWAVGEEGAVFTPDALEQYTPSNPPDGGTLNAVFSFNGSAWMVGEHGRLLRYIPGVPIGSTNWSESNVGGDSSLRGVTGEGSGAALPRIWIVGERGAVFRSDAGGFEQVDAGVRLDLRGVYSPGLDEVWAVGSHGALVKYQGGRWRDVTGGVTRNLHALWGTSSGDVLAVGDDLTALARTDVGWAPVYQNPDFGNALALWGDGAGTVWVVGDGRAIVELESNAFKTSTYTSEVLRGIWGMGPGVGEVWAVGGRDAGAVLRFEADGGGTWRYDPFSGEPLNGVWGTTLADLRVVGNGGTIYRRGDGGWPQELKLDSPLNAIWGSNPNDIWAVGDEGAAVHWTDGGWSKDTIAKANLLAVRGRSATDVWAVGSEGTVVRWDGSRWLRVPAPTSRDLTGIAFGEGGKVWMVGADGVILMAVE